MYPDQKFNLLQNQELWEQKVMKDMNAVQLAFSSGTDPESLFWLLNQLLKNGHTDMVLKLFNMKDDTGTKVRTLALGHTDKHIRSFARTFGTYLGRYVLDEGPPVHRSKTCSVFFASDLENNEEEVALKIFTNEDKSLLEKELNRELEARQAGPNSTKKNRNKRSSKMLEFLHYEHTIEIKRAHCDANCIVMERGSRSLFEAMNSERIAGENINEIRNAAFSVARALEELHEIGKKVHADIKARNIVRIDHAKVDSLFHWEGSFIAFGAGNKTDSQPRASWKLIDLDATVPVGDHLSNKNSTGYSPPELAKELFRSGCANDFQPKLEASPSYDVWSFGVLLYELLTGTPLFLVNKSDDNLVSASDKAELANWIALDEERLARLDSAASTLGKENASLGKKLVKRCLIGDPEQRITIEEILMHEFFSQYQDETRPLIVPKEKRHPHSHRSSRFSKRLSGFLGRTTSKKRKDKATQSISEEMEAHSSDHQPRPDDQLKYHFFLSHMQAEASGIVKDLYLNLQFNRCTAWLDVRAKDLTAAGMKKGVEQSKYFLLVLTKNVLFRPYCINELFWAIKAEKQVVCVIEEDSRFAPFDETKDCPWVDQLGKDNERCDFLLTQLKKQLNVQDPSAMIAKIGENFKHEFIKVPYRRRDFEASAMMNHLFEKCGLLQPSALKNSLSQFQLSEDQNETTQILIIRDSSAAKKADFMKQSIEKMLEPRAASVDQQLAGSFRANKTKAKAVVLLLTNGFFENNESAAEQLEQFWQFRSTDRRAFVVVQDRWKFGGNEQTCLTRSHQDLSTEMFSNTETLQWRDEEYERNGLAQELIRRIRKQLASSSKKVRKKTINKN